MRFWAALWNIPDPLSRKMCPACMIWPMSNLHSSLFLLPFFVCFFFLLSRTNASVQVFWTLPYPSPHKFHSLDCECSVTHWLPPSDVRSDWSSPCSSHMAAKYSSCVPFSFFPLLFPSAMRSPGSGFRALSLACSFPQLGSQWERTLYFLRMAVGGKTPFPFMPGVIII